MKIIKNNIVIYFTIYILQYTTYTVAIEDISANNNGRYTKSYANEILTAEEYYDAGLKGKLMRAEKRKPLLLSSLKLISKKPQGAAEGGVYKDVNDGIWIVKKAQNPEKEYIGSKVMDLLIGPLSPKIELLADSPDYTASKLLPGFLMQKDVMNDPNHKPIIGEGKLLVAMDLIGLTDRNEGNQGYIDKGDKLEAARVDFDHSFNFNWVDSTLTESVDSKALESIITIPDEMILYVLGDAYNDLWEIGISLDNENYKNLGPQLIARKHALKNVFLEQLAYEKLYNKAKKTPLAYTKEDYNQLLQFISDLYKIKNPNLAWAINTGEPNVVLLFLNNDAEFNATDALYQMPLHYAVLKRHLNVVRLLLDKGFDVNAENYFGETPLHYATKNGYLDITRLLLNRGANIDTKNSFEQTPLHLSTEKGYLNIIHLLLSNDAEINTKNEAGETALHLAVEKGYLDIVRLLLENGADIDAKNTSDETALHLAVEKRYLDIIRLLLEDGADVDAKNGWDETALDLAISNNYLDIVHLLEEKQQNINNETNAEKLH